MVKNLDTVVLGLNTSIEMPHKCHINNTAHKPKEQAGTCQILNLA